MADQVQQVSAPAAPVQEEQVQAAEISLSSAHFINVVNLGEYIKPETLAFVHSAELNEQDRILKATLDSRTLAALHVKKLIPGGKVGHVFKFQSERPIQVTIANHPCVFLPLDGNFMVQVGQELPTFLMDHGKGVLLNEGAVLEVWPQFKPQRGFLPAENIYHGALIELESLNVVRPKRKATVVDEGEERNPKEPRAIYTYAQRDMAIFMLQMKMDLEWVAKETGPKCTAKQVLKWKETYDKQRFVREQLEKLITEAADGRYRGPAPAPEPDLILHHVLLHLPAQVQVEAPELVEAVLFDPQEPAQPEIVADDLAAPPPANAAVLLPVPPDAAEHEPEEIVAEVDNNMDEDEENSDDDLLA